LYLIAQTRSATGRKGLFKKRPRFIAQLQEGPIARRDRCRKAIKRQLQPSNSFVATFIVVI
jgi:hypothetical protein